MLLWLAKAAGVDADLQKIACDEAHEQKTLMAKSAAVRKRIPWDMIAYKLWPAPKAHTSGWVQRFLKKHFIRP